MLNKLRSKQGFTLIELLIVVAIIGILAAIAIPQFATYRIKGFNSSAQSDVRNLSTTEAAYFADWQRFGWTESAATLPGGGGATSKLGNAIAVTAGTIPMITADDNAGTTRGLQIPLGSGISIVASTSTAGNNFTGAAKHLQGDTYYGVDSDTTAIFFAQVAGSAGTVLAATDEPAPVNDADDFVAAAATVGTPATAWASR